MTKAQELTIEKIKKEIPRFDFYDKDDYEIKKFEVEENEYFVSVYFVTGIKNDEGTMAGVLCRKHRHCFIGKNGGIIVPRRRGKTCFRSSVFDFMNKHYYY